MESEKTPSPNKIKMEETKILFTQVPMKPSELSQNPNEYIKKALIERKSQLTTKDSGHVLPGIGGTLDLIDSICFGAPVLFFYLLLLG